MITAALVTGLLALFVFPVENSAAPVAGAAVAITALLLLAFA
jgi:hypothetical protein